MKYQVIVAGSVMGEHKDRQDALRHLEQLKNSWLRMVHPINVFYIREKA